MLVDFCHWSLHPIVSCDKPSCDGYEVENLVSKDLSLHRKGFLAANFIKAPVNITFQFPCKISIHHVLINPVVGAQKSTSVEIYTSCKRISSSWLVPEESLQIGGRGRFTFDSPLFMNVGKVSLDSPSRVCFTYPRFGANAPYSVESLHTDGCVMSELRNSRYQYLTAVSQLTVRIVRTSGSCLPSLKSVEILGQPASSNGKEISHRVYKLFHDSVYAIPVKQETSQQTKNDDVNPEIDTGLQIPDEFIDPITCEVMALPVLLPCGKSVDQLTLERYIDTESSWGRCPSDPFTGVVFSAESRPMPNDSLKVRIDAFLFKNANHDKLKSVPRTVGRNEQATQNQTCNINIQPSVSNLTHRETDAKRKFDFDDHESARFSKSKKIRTRTLPDSKSETMIIKSEPVEVLDPKPSSSQGRGGNSYHQNDKSVSSSSHERQLDNSLSQAMSLLSGLPSFTRKSKPEIKTPETDRNKCCSNCSSTIEASTATYRLQCSHVICRKCVTKPSTSDQSLRCGQCDRYCVLSDVTRVHVV